MDVNPSPAVRPEAARAIEREPAQVALPLDVAARGDLEALQAQTLRRTLRRVDSPPGPRVQIDGVWLRNFASNDYLGLAGHPVLKEAAMRALATWGVGAGASRLICGSLAPHHRLEETLAAFHGTEAALSFSSGYVTALGTLGALLGRGDLAILDKRVHACLVDAARLSGATLRVFRHNDLNQLEAHLRWATARRSATPGPGPGPGRRPRVLVVTESVFSMDGDRAPLAEIVSLKDRHGAWLLVDEAHATGVIGPGRRGLAEALGVAPAVDLHLGTLGKALGTAGGYLAGSRPLIDLLLNRARSFVFSTAPPPAVAAAATAAVQLVAGPEGEARAGQAWERVTEFAAASPTSAPTRPQPASAIVPLLLGEAARAVEAAAALRDRGFFVPPIRYPTVARGTARLRLTFSAAHTSADVAALVAALRELIPAPSSFLP